VGWYDWHTRLTPCRAPGVRENGAAISALESGQQKKPAGVLRAREDLPGARVFCSSLSSIDDRANSLRKAGSERMGPMQTASPLGRSIVLQPSSIELAGA